MTHYNPLDAPRFEEDDRHEFQVDPQPFEGWRTLLLLSVISAFMVYALLYQVYRLVRYLVGL